ncbi:putative nagB/RpiA transferase [Helianthus debilis subsp. tardiflorus]
MLFLCDPNLIIFFFFDFGNPRCSTISTFIHFLNKLKKRKIEGSEATAKLTTELLRSVISQQRLPKTNQARALIQAIKAIGDQLTTANPVEVAVGNIVRRVLHIIREEDVSLTTASNDRVNLFYTRLYISSSFVTRSRVGNRVNLFYTWLYISLHKIILD